MHAFALLCASAPILAVATAVADPAGDEYDPRQGGNEGWGKSGNGGVLPRPPLCAGRATPQCCEADVSGVLALTCSAPPGEPSNKQRLQEACASVGKGSKCCLLSIVSSDRSCALLPANIVRKGWRRHQLQCSLGLCRPLAGTGFHLEEGRCCSF